MKRCNLWGPPCVAPMLTKTSDAYLWLQLIHAPNSFINVPSLDSIPDQHAFLDGLVVDADVDAGFLGEFDGGIAVTFDDEVIENDAVEISGKKGTRSAPFPCLHNIKG